MQVRVRVPTQLRSLVGCSPILAVDVASAQGATVGTLLDVLAVDHPALERRVRDERGSIRVHVNLFVGADNIRDLDGLATPIASSDELSIIAAVSGG